jgi:uncharacterized membrane protein (UPF0127 family)
LLPARCIIEKFRTFPHVPRVKFFSIVLAWLAISFAGCQKSQQRAVAQATSAPPAAVAPPYLPYAQPRLQTIKLFVGKEELSTELAMKPVEIYTGMMWRTNMPEGEAMLFVFPAAEPRAFYMRNTLVPLSLAYIDPEGVIQEIHDLQPREEKSVPSKSENIQFVLEVPQGWFKRHNIETGTVVQTQFGELKKAFSFRRAP